MFRWPWFFCSGCDELQGRDGEPSLIPKLLCCCSHTSCYQRRWSCLCFLTSSHRFSFRGIFLPSGIGLAIVLAASADALGADSHTHSRWAPRVMWAAVVLFLMILASAHCPGCGANQSKLGLIWTSSDWNRSSLRMLRSSQRWQQDFVKFMRSRTIRTSTTTSCLTGPRLWPDREHLCSTTT